MESNKIKIKNILLNVWKKFLNVSIRIKLIGLAIFTAFFLGFVIIYFMFSFYNGEISHDAKFMSIVIGKRVAEDAAGFILNRNVNRMNNLLRNEIKDNKGILYIFYRNNKGIIVAHAFRKGFYLNIVNNNNNNMGLDHEKKLTCLCKPLRSEK